MSQWNYSYDNLNRLINAAAPVSQPTGANAYFAGVQSGWSDDAFGNRLSEAQGAIPGASPTASMPTSSTATYTAGSNQLASSLAFGITYDAAGDVIYDGTNSYLYDADTGQEQEWKGKARRQFRGLAFKGADHSFSVS